MVLGSERGLCTLHHVTLNNPVDHDYEEVVSLLSLSKKCLLKFALFAQITQRSLFKHFFVEQGASPCLFDNLF